MHFNVESATEEEAVLVHDVAPPPPLRRLQSSMTIEDDVSTDGHMASVRWYEDGHNTEAAEAGARSAPSRLEVRLGRTAFIR